MLVIISFVLPSRVVDEVCYKEIAEIECDDTTLDYDNSGFYIGVGRTNFQCCDYSNVDNTSRKVYDNLLLCDSYKFIEEDHNKCSTIYKYWKEI